METTIQNTAQIGFSSNIKQAPVRYCLYARKSTESDEKQAMIDISHNLQTPLAIIKGEIEMFADSSIHSEKIKHVKRSIHQISQFIRQLLHLAKLDHAAFDITLVPVNFSALLIEQIEYIEVMAAEKDVRIQSSIAEGVIIVGNKKLLSELLINLISNAIKYRRKDKTQSTITITLSRIENMFELIVSDNGIGISVEDMPGMFTLFYRGSRKSNIAGTGLGLAICKKIVEKHQGSISVTSAPRKQTDFTILFPVYTRNI